MRKTSLTIFGLWSENNLGRQEKRCCLGNGQKEAVYLQMHNEQRKKERNSERTLPNLSDSKGDGEIFVLGHLQDSDNVAKAE